MKSEPDYTVKLDAAELEALVEETLMQIAADDRRARRRRWLAVVCGLAIAWCLGASCALSAVGK